MVDGKHKFGVKIRLGTHHSLSLSLSLSSVIIYKLSHQRLLPSLFLFLFVLCCVLFPFFHQFFLSSFLNFPPFPRNLGFPFPSSSQVACVVGL
ncbi:hypothetical protein VNO78_19930 [Psophocarpus tetragonolobus]|uniref:Uncharacterized protein n=1 Tax=Psophocarpus tetragonolobus TaxID=3891 RepID=A0AAN9SA04_PSOTE